MERRKRVDRILNVSGLLCPRPAIIANNTLKEMREGQLLEVVSNDNNTKKTIPELCREAGYTLVETREGHGMFRFIIQNNGGKK